MVDRVTQRMATANSLSYLQKGLAGTAKVQEQLSTGRILNRPSDNPTDTTAAMRLRTTISDSGQYARNAQDGIGWLGQIDSTLQTMSDQVRRARELGLQAANDGAMGPTSRAALATEIEEIRRGLISAANAKYLDRPVFGGVTAGNRAYQDDGTFAGLAGTVSRRVADGVSVRVDTLGTDVFGSDADNLFRDLQDLADDVRAGDTTDVRAGIDKLKGRMDDITAALSDVGSRMNRVERAGQEADDAKLQLSSNLSTLENTDLAKATVDLQMAEVAYQAALAATARVIQPSLLDFLR